MKVEVECTLGNGEAEITISLLERVPREEFDEYSELMRREGFEYDPYTYSNSFTTESPKMLRAMFKFLDKEFEVSATLKGAEKYSWDRKDAFIEEFAASLSGQ
jgi:hypothetical protein